MSVMMNIEKKKLMNKDFFLLWQGQLVSQVGTQAFHIAMMFWVKHQTGSASLMGLIMMIAMIPAVILGPIGGTVADRVSRKKIIVIGDMLNGIIVSGLAVLMFYYSDHTKLIIVILFIVSMLVGIVGSFFRPAISASIPDIVPEDKIATANSLNQFSVQLSTFIGQGAGGIFFRLLGAPFLFLVDGITYLFSSLSESFIDIPQKLPEKSKNLQQLWNSFKNELIEGFHYVWEKPGMKNLFLMASVLNFFSMPVIVLLPFYVEDFLGVRADWYGYLMAGFGFGSMIGYLVAGVIKVTGNMRKNLMIISLILSSLFIYFIVLIQTSIASLVLFIIMGIVNGYINVNILTILQLSTHSTIRGRVFGLLQTISAGLTPIAMALSGLVFDIVNHNISLIFTVCGFTTALISITASTNKDFRDYLGYEP